MAGDIRLGINAKDAQYEIKNITEKIKELNSAMDEAAKSKDWGSFNSLASAMNNLEGYKRGMLNESKGIQSNLPMQNPVSNVLGSATNTVNTIGNGISAAGSGNVSGMLSSGGQLTQSAAKGLGALGVGAGATAAILGAAGLVFAGGAAAQKASQVWENQMDSAINNGTFYNENRFNMSASENSSFLRSRFNQASEIRRGTQYSTEEVLEIQNEMAKYGYNAQNSKTDSQAIINAMANTGASKDALTKLSGIANLYGYDGAMTIQNVYQGLKDSGMTDARMDEFIQSVTQAMEEGVSKGFVGSVEDIVNNVSLFSRLSGGDAIWTGKEGAARANKIGSGFASAVNLNSVTDMMMYGSAKGVIQGLSPEQISAITGGINDPTIAARMIMEQGTNGAYFSKMLGNYAQNISAQFGYDPEMQLQAYMKSFGLNVTGATQLMNLMNKWAENGYSENYGINEEVQKIIDRNENKSTETEYKSTINSIKDEVASMGQHVLSLKNFIVKDPSGGALSDQSKNKIKGLIEDENEAEQAVYEIEKNKNTSLINFNEAVGYQAAVAGTLSSVGYESKVKLMPEMIKYYSRNKGYSSYMTDAVSSESIGINDRDQIFNELVAQAAMTGNLKGKIAEKNDGIITETEMKAVLDKVSKDDTLKTMYYRGSTDEYVNALKSMLTQLFENVDFNIHN